MLGSGAGRKRVQYGGRLSSASPISQGPFVHFLLSQNSTTMASLEISAPSEDQHNTTTEDEVPKKRSRNGRSSRRRKAKIRAIQEAEQKLWNGEAVENKPVTGIPSDRSSTWPGVLERRSEKWRKEDEASLVGQLGYLPGNGVAVAARSSQFPKLGIPGDVPIILQLYPIAVRNAFLGGKSDGRKFKSRKRGNIKEHKANREEDQEEQEMIEPFPTTYWLTHPLLRTLTSKLELGKSHNVKVLESKLAADPIALASMKTAHESYGQARWGLLTKADRELMESRQWKGALTTGVAGIRKPFAIKCLHAQLAHYLSGGPGSAENLIGKWVAEELYTMVQEHATTVVTTPSVEAP